MLAGERLDETVRAAVSVVGCQQQVAGCEQLEGDRDGGHPCGCDDARHAMLELRNGAREQVTRRITGTRIVVRPFRTDILECERGGQLYRRDDSAVLRVG